MRFLGEKINTDIGCVNIIEIEEDYDDYDKIDPLDREYLSVSVGLMKDKSGMYLLDAACDRYPSVSEDFHYVTKTLRAARIWVESVVLFGRTEGSAKRPTDMRNEWEKYFMGITNDGPIENNCW